MKNNFSLLGVLLFVLFTNLALAQSKTVSGLVKATDSGDPLPGVAVLEKGTQNGTVTDFDGKFTLTVSGNSAVLQMSSMGMETKEISVGSNDFLVVNLELAKDNLDEVVVTALGISREKKSLGYAVTNLDSEELQRSGESDVVSSLNAKVPGLQVVGSGGTPGASTKILIRGNATFTGQNQPLIVIDGVPIDNRTTQSSPRDYPFNANLQGVNNSNRAIDINPDDIESVTVLKGPAAAALYGERAGNGAIIYTTKRGKGGKKGLGIKFSSSVEFTTVNKLPGKQDKYVGGTGGGALERDSLGNIINVGSSNAGFIGPADPGPDGIGLTADDISYGTNQSWGPSVGNYGGPTYDPMDIFQTGVGYRNSLEVSGGEGNSSVRLSIGDLRQTGIVPNSNFNRTSVRLTADTKLHDKVTIGGTVNYIRSTQKAVQNGSNLAGVMLGALRTPISYDLKPYLNSQGFQQTYYVVYDNPYYTANANPFTSDVNRILGNVYLNYQISPEWNFTYRLGVDAYGDNRKQIFAISSFGDDIGGVGQINENRLSSRELYGDGIVSYNKKLTESLKLQVRLGHNFRINEFNDLFGRGRELAIPNFYNMNNASDLYTSQYTENIKSQALFGEIALDYDGWLYLSFTGRNEWSSTFELENNNFFYPSASASVVFSELLDLPEWLSFGKVRYSFAQVGISPIAYATRPVYTSPTYTDGFTNGLTVPYNGQNGFGISNTLFGASGLRPEIQTGNEFGINLNFLKGLIDVDYTFYIQKSTDLLLFLPTPGSSGFQSSYTNAGEMTNQGHEVYIGINAIRRDDFKWTVGLNWSKNTSEVTKLAVGVDEVSIEAAFGSIGSFAIVGEPLGVFYGTRWARDANDNKLIGANGLPIVADQTGNVGNPLPNWLGGIRNTFEYKGVQLSFLFDFRNGGDIWNGTYARMNNLGVSEDSEDRERTFVVDGVYAPGTVIDGNDVSGQANSTEISANSYWRQVEGDAGGAAEQFVETVNWVRLRDASLSYRFDWSKNEKGVQYLNISLTGRNLWLSTNYKGVDPETSLTGAGSNIGGFDYFNNPGTRSYLIGVSLGF